MERDNEKVPLDAEVDDERQNAGLDDDEGGDEASGESAEAQSDEAEEGLGSRASRERTYKDQLRAESERSAALQRELEQLRSQQQPRYQGPQEESDEQFNSRLQMMTMEERFEARFQRSERRHQIQTAISTFQNADRVDRMAYDAKSQASPTRKRLAAEVEQILAQERARGRDFDRETVYLFLRGRLAEHNDGKVSQARTQGQQRIQKQQSRTEGGRGDQTAQPRRRAYAADDMSPAAVEWRLSQDGVYI